MVEEIMKNEDSSTPINGCPIIIERGLCWFGIWVGREWWWSVVDEEHMGLVRDSAWEFSRKGIKRRSDGKLLHRLVMSADDPNVCVMFENKVKWDCRSENLLMISRSELRGQSATHFRMFDRRGNVVGVRRGLKKIKGKVYAFWEASAGSKYKKRFSVIKWGEEGAAKAAVKFRLDSLEELDAQMFTPDGLPDDWDDLMPARYWAG